MPINIKVKDNTSLITGLDIEVDEIIVTAKNAIAATKITDILSALVRWSKRDGGKNKLNFTVTLCEQLNDKSRFSHTDKQFTITGDLKLAAEYLKEGHIDNETHKKLIESIEKLQSQEKIKYKFEESKESYSPFKKNRTIDSSTLFANHNKPLATTQDTKIIKKSSNGTKIP